MKYAEHIGFIERNPNGSWGIFGDIGFRQYYFYTKKQAIKLYKDEYKRINNTRSNNLEIVDIEE